MSAIQVISGAPAGDAGPTTVELFGPERPLRLASGRELAPVRVAYETWGRLDAEGANAVVVCHALTGDSHATGQGGWWNAMVGAGRPVDPSRHYVVCANILGGCRGTTGPSSIDPATGRPYGLRFPMYTVGDQVEVQRALCAHLGVRRPLTAIGGSLGGMQALHWALAHPGELRSAVLVGATARLSAQNIAFSEVARQAIMRDPAFAGGDYEPPGPRDGLAVARMLAHITYLSEAGLALKFDRRPQGAGPPGLSFDAEFQVESYLRHQGESFVRRFDANTYLYLTRCMDLFDPLGEGSPLLARLHEVTTRFLLLSFSTDWRFPTRDSLAIAATLGEAGVPVEQREIGSPFGHDSFLMDGPEYLACVGDFLERVAGSAA
jgi:homoserine O-acetyltransferase/O-succinyltransferase